MSKVEVMISTNAVPFRIEGTEPGNAETPKSRYFDDASSIYQLFFRNLPGGTYDHLLMKMLAELLEQVRSVPARYSPEFVEQVYAVWSLMADRTGTPK